MFGFNKVKKYHAESTEMVQKVLERELFDLEHPLTNQVVGSYIFGMLNALAQDRNVDSADVQAGMIKVASESLGYSLEQSVEFSQHLIESTDREFDETTFLLIHRGIEGYFMYKETAYDQLLDDIQEVIAIVAEGAD